MSQRLGGTNEGDPLHPCRMLLQRAVDGLLVGGKSALDWYGVRQALARIHGAIAASAERLKARGFQATQLRLQARAKPSCWSAAQASRSKSKSKSVS